jgi:hypothetical protein
MLLWLHGKLIGEEGERDNQKEGWGSTYIVC